MTTATERREQILNLIAGFCAQKLNKEYLSLAKKVLRQLGNIEPVPYAKGKPEIWAAGIIHMLGSINWMFDRCNKYYTPSTDINAYFGTNGSTTGNKAALIKDLLDIRQGDREFSTQHTIDQDLFAQFVMVNDMIMPVTTLAEELLEQLRQARAEGRDLASRTK